MPELSPINVEVATKRFHIQVDDLIAMIEESLPYLQERTTSLCEAAATGQTDQVVKEAHAIKGSAATLGMEELQGHAQEVENLGKGISQGDLPAHVESLRAALLRAMNHAASLGANVKQE